MIDIHCHIIYGMDDGAVSVNEAINMATLAQKTGIDTIVATPHFVDYSNIEEFVFERDVRVDNLNRLLQQQQCEVKVLTGAEVHLDNNVFTADALDELTINNSDYMLCEFSLKPFSPKTAVELAEEIVNRGHKPIIAHPERYITFFEYPFIVNELSDLGCYFQVNASCLAGHGGNQMQSFTYELIKRGFVDFIASDAHSSNSRNNNIREKIASFPEEISDEQLNWMLNTATKKVIENKVIEIANRRYF